MVVVIRRGVLAHEAKLGMVGVHLSLRLCFHSGRVVQVCGVRGVGDEGGVLGLGGGRARRLHPLGAKQRSQERGGVGERLATVTRRAVSARGGSPPHARTVNDGALRRRGQSDHR